MLCFSSCMDANSPRTGALHFTTIDDLWFGLLTWQIFLNNTKLFVFFMHFLLEYNIPFEFLYWCIVEYKKCFENIEALNDAFFKKQQDRNAKPNVFEWVWINPIHLRMCHHRNAESQLFKVVCLICPRSYTPLRIHNGTILAVSRWNCTFQGQSPQLSRLLNQRNEHALQSWSDTQVKLTSAQPFASFGLC